MTADKIKALREAKRLDTGRPCAQIGHHQKRSELLGAGTFHTITGLSGGLGNSVFRVYGLFAWH